MTGIAVAGIWFTNKHHYNCSGCEVEICCVSKLIINIEDKSILLNRATARKLSVHEQVQDVEFKIVTNGQFHEIMGVKTQTPIPMVWRFLKFHILKAFVDLI